MNSPAEDDGTLGTGTRLGEFEIRGLIGVGGFGIVYRAFDHDLEREVAIKEYMPGLLASRTVNGEVQPRSRTHAETFGAGMRSFMLEAKMLARFDHPALVKVFRYWEGNGTAYMVMPLYQGQTLGHVLKQMPAPPSEAWLMGVLVPLLGALEVLHSQQIFHRDVSPDNILLLRNGRPVLLDFGAARQVISDRTQTLTAILKPNYAPIEQYAEVPNLRQGPWTDLYALGAVVYASLTGKPPPPAAARTIQDDIVPLADIAARLEAEKGLRYSRAFLDAWQQTLAVRPADRPQNVADLMRRLGLMPTATLGMDDDSTVIVPNGTPGAGSPPPPRQDSDWTVVVTGQRFTHHPDAYSGPATPVAAAPATAAPPAPEPAADPPVTITQHTGMSPTTGRDMRMIRPGTTQSPASTPATAPAPAPTSAPAPMTVPAGLAPSASPAPAAARPADPLTPLESQPRKGGGLLIGAVAGALALAAGGYFLLRSTGPVAPAAEPAPVAVSAAAPAERPPAADNLPVPASAAALPAPVASRPVPPMITEYPEESASRPAAAATAAAPKPAPATPAASAAAAAAQPAAASKPDRAAQAAAKASAAAAKASAAAAQAAAKASAAAAAVAGRHTPATNAQPASNTAPASGKPAAPGSASASTEARPAKTEPRTPEEVCGKRVLMARALCIQEACRSAEFSHQPACVDIRRKAEEEERRQMNAGG